LADQGSTDRSGFEEFVQSQNLRTWDDDIQEAKGISDMYRHVDAQHDGVPHLSPF
jgi:hypothetical protein